MSVRSNYQQPMQTLQTLQTVTASSVKVGQGGQEVASADGANNVKPPVAAAGKHIYRTTTQGMYDDAKNGGWKNGYYGDHAITNCIINSRSFTLILDNGDMVTYQVNSYR